MELHNDDGVVAFELWDNAGRSVTRSGDFTALPQPILLRATENFIDSGLRNIYRTTEAGSVRLVVRADAELFQGNKSAARACAIYLSLLPKFKQIEISRRQSFDSIITRFAHNLVKFQARFKGNFARLISDQSRSRPIGDFQDEVKRRIEQNTSIAAYDVCQMSHRAVDLDAQIETLRVISGYADSSAPTRKIKADLQKTIYRLMNPFVDELQARGVTINNRIPPISTGDEKVLLDPALFNAAIWQLLDNASKYVQSGTAIDITAQLTGQPKRLELSMISVCIDPDEEELVFIEGTKGRHAGKKGENGIGLFIVRKALGLMKATIYVKNEGAVCEMDGYKYCRHRFVVEFGQ